MWVDSQCHVSPGWYEPVETLLWQMDRVGVSQAVLIQLLGQTDNRYQQECLTRFPGRFASVVLVDPGVPDAPDQLRILAAQGAGGVRLRPTARSPGPDPLAIWRCATELGLAVSCVGTSEAFASTEFAKVISQFPELHIVLEHLGGTSTPSKDPAAQRQHLDVMDLARFPNLYLKVPGLGELMQRDMSPGAGQSPFLEGVPTILAAALDVFGAQRLMWGSDFPPVSSREGYGNSLKFCRRALQDLGVADLNPIFADVARRVFKLPSPSSPISKTETNH